MIGNIIKAERKKKEIKQKVLAKGICSASYLCKIETNKVVPNREITKLLFERLQIPLDILNSDDSTKEINEAELLKIYQEVVATRSNSDIEKQLAFLQENESRFLGNDLFNLFSVVETYIRLVLEKDISLLQKRLLLLEEYKEQFNPTINYLLKKCWGIFYYKLRSYEQSNVNYEKAMNQFPNTFQEFESYEKADLNYWWALLKFTEDQFILSIELAETAVQYFNKALHLDRVAETYILIGVSYQKLQSYNRAVDIFKRSYEIARLTKQKALETTIYQNLGAAYSALGELDVSLEYYKKSLALRETPKDKLVSILSIAQLFSKMNDKEMMENWLEKGLEIVKIENVKEEYYYHFVLYKQLFLKFDNLPLVDEALSYFEQNQDGRYVYKYGIKVASLLEEANKYKLATKYYRRATKVDLLKLNYWEDL